MCREKQTHPHPHDTHTTGRREDTGGQNRAENANRNIGVKGGAGAGERHGGWLLGGTFFCLGVEGVPFFLILGANSFCYGSGKMAGNRKREWVRSMEWQGREVGWA